MARFSSFSFARLLLSATGVVAGLTVDVDDAASIKKAAALVAQDLMSFYTGEIPGLLPGPPPEGDYYQWTGGALWATMLDYRSRTGDTQYDDKISQGLLWQRGSNNDFLPANWTASEGNDDQAIWGMAALLAAETGFAEPEVDNLKWLTLVQNVFDEQSSDARRVENGSCAGGLRWQILPFNNGYNYVSTLANVAYANLGARLTLQDGNNKTQAQSVEDTFDWLQTTKLIDATFNVFDGSYSQNCYNVNKAQFSFSAGLAVESAAVMYNSTGGDGEWKKRLDGLLQKTLNIFFQHGIATEISCESAGTCTTDFTFYKSFLHRSLASTMKVAPYTADLILPTLTASAQAAAKSCTEGDNNRMCKFVWSAAGDDPLADNQTGAGPQMSVLSALLSLLPAETVVNNPDSGSNSGSTTGSGQAHNATTSTGGSSTPSQSNIPGNSGAREGVSAVVVLGSLLLTSFALNWA
ncbi:glycosyl hydrolase family 76-domain-containing protein [Xylaria telfairii]|nr:glycosyl hydrolase family 76-domain-containing protein [Xylaria telfairii]